MNIRSAVIALTPPVLMNLARRASGKKKVPIVRSTINIAGRTLRIHPDSYEPLAAFFGRHPECTAEMNQFVRLTKDSERLLDIGALHGVFSLTFASMGKKAVAVDASPIAYARLLYNVHANPEIQITPVERAVSDKTGGELSMNFDWEHAVATAGPGAITVPCETADDICARLGFVPDAIKIDVEGHEAQVLAGMGTVLAAKPLIFFETHPAHFDRRALQSQIDRLRTMGYRSVSGPSLESVMDRPNIERLVLAA